MPSSGILETGIKVIDLLCPFIRGGKTGLFGGAGVGKPLRSALRFAGGGEPPPLEHMGHALHRLDETIARLAIKRNALRQEEIVEEIEVILSSDRHSLKGSRTDGEPPASLPVLAKL